MARHGRLYTDKTNYSNVCVRRLALVRTVFLLAFQGVFFHHSRVIGTCLVCGHGLAFGDEFICEQLRQSIDNLRFSYFGLCLTDYTAPTRQHELDHTDHTDHGYMYLSAL